MILPIRSGPPGPGRRLKCSAARARTRGAPIPPVTASRAPVPLPAITGVPHPAVPGPIPSQGAIPIGAIHITGPARRTGAHTAGPAARAEVPTAGPAHQAAAAVVTAGRAARAAVPVPTAAPAARAAVPVLTAGPVARAAAAPPGLQGDKQLSTRSGSSRGS